MLYSMTYYRYNIQDILYIIYIYYILYIWCWYIYIYIHIYIYIYICVVWCGLVSPKDVWAVLGKGGLLKERRLKTPTIKSNPINLALHKIAWAELFQVVLAAFTTSNTSCMLRHSIFWKYRSKHFSKSSAAILGSALFLWYSSSSASPMLAKIRSKNKSWSQNGYTQGQRCFIKSKGPKDLKI